MHTAIYIYSLYVTIELIIPAGSSCFGLLGFHADNAYILLRLHGLMCPHTLAHGGVGCLHIHLFGMSLVSGFRLQGTHTLVILFWLFTSEIKAKCFV